SIFHTYSGCNTYSNILTEIISTAFAVYGKAHPIRSTTFISVCRILLLAVPPVVKIPDVTVSGATFGGKCYGSVIVFIIKEPARRRTMLYHNGIQCSFVCAAIIIAYSTNSNINRSVVIVIAN